MFMTSGPDLGLHSLLRSVCLILRANMVLIKGATGEL